MIPIPTIVKETGGSFRIPVNVRVYCDGLDPIQESIYEQSLTDWLESLKKEARYQAPLAGLSIEISIDFEGDEDTDEYVITLTRQVIKIMAPGSHGIYYGIQTLKQLMWEAIWHNQGRIKCGTIYDKSVFPWRGLHLDVSRHFFSAEEVMTYLDWMGALKLNCFHWHLSDDQGWRIESKRFPKLTEKGAWRREADGSRYGGFYTRDEIEAILLKAALNCINVIPEIDLPGHAMAILSAYPELACFPQEFEPLSVWGISEDILCAGKDATLDFLKELLSEVAELFPSPIIHIGGDEAPKARWKACPHCQQRIKDHKLKDEEALQGWLIRELRKHLRKLGKEIMGWDEILDGNPGKGPLISCWRGDGIAAARKASQNGNPYVICPNQFLYFDWKDSEDGPGAFGVTSLEKVMSLKPEDYEFDRPELLLGGQANLWTEHMEDFDKVEEMLFPRVYALSELFWAGKIESGFEERMGRMEDLF